MILMLFCMQFSTAIILASNRGWASFCPSDASRYQIDSQGTVRKIDDNSIIIGRQCLVEYVSFSNETKKDICHEDGKDVLVIRSTWGQSFFHFLFNELQRFYNSFGHGLKDPLILGSGWSYTHAQREDWLELFGARGRSITELPSRVRRVVVAPGVDSCVSIQYSFVDFIRHQAAEVMKTHCDFRIPRIVWLRRDLHTRAIEEDEMHRIIGVLKRNVELLGFGNNTQVVVHNPESRLSETYRLFQCSHPLLIVGAHGAALSNMVLAPEFSYVLELHPRVYVEGERDYQNCFFDVAAASRIRFASAIASSESSAFVAGHMKFSSASIVAALNSLRLQATFIN